MLENYLENDIPVERGSVAAAFGCNYQGDMPVETIMDIVKRIFEMADEYKIRLKELSFADTMAWATPAHIKKLVGAVREKWPEQRLSLHLHDTRGMGIANAYAGMEMGVDMFDACAAGLGGCPFAGLKARPGTGSGTSRSCARNGHRDWHRSRQAIDCARLRRKSSGIRFRVGEARGNLRIAGYCGATRSACGHPNLPRRPCRLLAIKSSLDDNTAVCEDDVTKQSGDLRARSFTGRCGCRMSARRLGQLLAMTL